MIGNEFTAFIAFTARTENSPATLSAEEFAGRLSLKESLGRAPTFDV